jgi:hypothetical protein
MILLRLRKKTRIADVADGQIATLRGVVASRQLLTIPPTGTACVFYSLLQEKFGHGKRGRGRPLWFVESLTGKCAEFTISDGSGAIAVREPGERLVVVGAHQEAGVVPKRKNRRFAAQFLRAGDEVIARGLVVRAGTNSDVVLKAPEKGNLQILVTRRSR